MVIVIRMVIESQLIKSGRPPDPRPLISLTSPTAQGGHGKFVAEIRGGRGNGPHLVRLG
jgi:hypothetical protein